MEREREGGMEREREGGIERERGDLALVGGKVRVDEAEGAAADV